MVYFIKPSDVIKRIRTTIELAEANLDLPEGFTSYAQRVGGSAHLADITEENIQALPTPSCFVALANGSTNTAVIEALDQTIFNGFDITVILDTVDRRQQSAEEAIVVFRELLIHCLNGWTPAGYSCSPLRFVGDSLAHSGKDKYVRVFTFAYDLRYLAAEDLLDTDDYDIQNFENFFGDLLAADNQALEVGVQKTNLYEDE